ncbi:MAG: TonB-dependent receptor [Acidobacteriota bacterium]
MGLRSVALAAGLCLFVSVTAVSLTPAPEAPPDRAALAGRVATPDGVGIPGATVQVRPQAGTEEIRVQTGEDGLFRAGGLTPGDYDVEVALHGYRRAAVPAVRLTAGEVRSLRFTMDFEIPDSEVDVVASDPRDGLSGLGLRESGAPDVGEALTRLPGLWNVRKGGIAGDVVLRGHQGDNVNVLIDGVHVQGACPNNMDPAAFHVDLSEVERIELGKGPFDVKNGGSLGGVVNIVTRTPEPGLHGTAVVSGGSFGHINPSATLSFGGDSVGFLAGASYRSSDPFADGNGVRFTEDAGYRKSAENSQAYRVRTGWAGMWFRPSPDHQVGVSVSRQEADHVLYPYLLMDGVWDNTDRLHADYAYTPSGPEGPVVEAQAYVSHVSHWMTDGYRTSSLSPMAPRGYTMGTYGRTKAEGARTEIRFGDTAVGVELARRHWYAVTRFAMAMYMPQYSLPSVDAHNMGLYASQAFRLSDRFTLDAGARLDASRSTADARLSNTDLYWAYKDTRSRTRKDTYPSGNLRLTASLPGGVEVRAGVGSSSRFPDPQELFFALRRMGADWVGNPALEVPRNTGVNLGFTVRRSAFYASANLFRDRVDSFITVHNQARLNMVPGYMNAVARSYANVDARFWGGELSLSAVAGNRVFLSLDAASVRATKDTAPALGIRSSAVAEIPPLWARAAVRYDTGRWFAEVEGVFADRQDSVDEDLRERPTPGYGIANARAGVTWNGIQATLILRNLFDRAYRDHLSYQRDPFRSGHRVWEPGRTLVVNLSYRF